MRNKSINLRNHLFEALERLQNDELTPEELQQEIQRSQAVSDVANSIINLAKAEIAFHRATASLGKTTEQQPFFQPTNELGDGKR